jgi:hypothetical protein
MQLISIRKLRLNKKLLKKPLPQEKLNQRDKPNLRKKWQLKP